MIKIIATLRAALTMVGLCLVVAPPVSADFGIDAFDGAVLDTEGNAVTQAGKHPDSASVTFALNRLADSEGLKADGGDLRNARVELPSGLVGNPAAVPVCSKRLEIPSNIQVTGVFDPNRFCPIDTIIGIADVTVAIRDEAQRFVGPVFNLEPPPGMPAQFGFSFTDQRAYLDTALRSDGDYGVNVSSRNISEVKPVLSSTVTLWGTPADSRHDPYRCLAFVGSFGEAAPLPQCDPLEAFFGRPWLAPNRANREPTAFMTNPTACTPAGAGLETRLHIESWAALNLFDQASFISHLPPGFPSPPAGWGPPHGPDRCEDVPFQPTFDARADTSKADAPAALKIDLSFPQDGLFNPTGLATAHLKRATVTLPEGWSVSPSAADGLAGCSDAESSVGTLLGARCPDASKIGTIEATTPLLNEKLSGGVYIGTQESDDPQSGRMFRLFLTLNNEERGIRVKLPGQVRVNPDTGRIETTFDNNPQVPVSTISLRLKGGPRAALATPLRCGAKTATAELESWSGAVAVRTSDLVIGCPGVGPLAPSFKAGTTTRSAGRHTSFVLRADRPDGQQIMNGLSLRMPPGLLATLKGVPRCSSSAADAGVCPESSRVGTTTVGAGPGTNPFFVSGGVYLTGPYKRAPFGLAVAVRAKAGPFDLGTVVVRQRLLVDPIDAHVDVVSDPLPTILKGVPIRLRSLNVDVDRSGFVLNPTSCAPRTLLAAFGAGDGSVFTSTLPFAASNCAGLAVKPRLKLALTGRGQTTDGKHPGAQGDADAAQGRRESEEGVGEVAAFPSVGSGQRQRRSVSSSTARRSSRRVRGASIVGRATAVTPILDEPLSGPVYFVKNVRKDPKSGRRHPDAAQAGHPATGSERPQADLEGNERCVRGAPGEHVQRDPRRIRHAVRLDHPGRS